MLHDKDKRLIRCINELALQQIKNVIRIYFYTEHIPSFYLIL